MPFIQIVTNHWIHMHKYNHLLTAVLAFFCTVNLFGQQSNVRIFHEFTPQGVVFYCENDGFGPCSVKLSFDLLLDGTAEVPLPFYGTVGPGRSRLFSIKSTDPKVRPRFNYSSRYAFGCLKTKPDTTILYLLPASPGKSVKCGPLNYLGQSFGNEKTPPNWNALVFKMEQCDTVFAARRGTVTDVRSDAVIKGSSRAFDRNDNFIKIAHSDCTVGYYSVLKEVFVKPGDVAQAGMPIGIAGGDDYISGNHVRFSVYYSDVKEMLDALQPQSVSRYMPIAFWTKEGRQPNLQKGGLHVAEHPEALVIKEMTKQELKKRKQASEKKSPR